MNAFVAVADNDWFRHLAAMPGIDEVNFWQPSGGRRFHALAPGEALLFKLHAPESFIVGGGFFAHFSILPSSLAWEAFGEKNGASSLEGMRRRVERYRRIPPDPAEDYNIGCIVLEEPFFFDQADWFLPPADFSPNVQVGKRYDLREPPHGTKLWEDVQFRLLLRHPDLEELEEAVRFGEPVPVRRRLGQGSFQVLVTDTYVRHCAVTGERALPVLEAAHIKPVAAGGGHRVENGLLLRSDVHKLFDRGYLTITPAHKLRVSRRLRDDFHNGEYYQRFDGEAIWVPANPSDRPGRAFLEWHADVLFRG